jgi:hypothetical protein
LFVIVAVIGAAATVALTNPRTAAADYASLHQHGWNVPLVENDLIRCTDQQQLYSWVTPGSVGFEPPNVMTSPVRPGSTRERVYFMAVLEWWDGSKFVGGWPSGSRYVYWKTTGWYYADANAVGLLSTPNWLIWREYGTDRYLGWGKISWDVPAGYFYRVHTYYYWGADGASADDTTAYCKVGVSIPGGVMAKATKAKKLKKAKIAPRSSRPSIAPRPAKPPVSSG